MLTKGSFTAAAPVDACASQILSKCWGPAGVWPRGSSAVMSTQPDMNFRVPPASPEAVGMHRAFLGIPTEWDAPGSGFFLRGARDRS